MDRPDLPWLPDDVWKYIMQLFVRVNERRVFSRLQRHPMAKIYTSEFVSNQLNTTFGKTLDRSFREVKVNEGWYKMKKQVYQKQYSKHRVKKYLLVSTMMDL